MWDLSSPARDWNCIPWRWKHSILAAGRQGKPLEKEMAIHSSILAWEFPQTEEPGGLWSMGSQRVRRDWAHEQLSAIDWVACEQQKFIFCSSGGWDVRDQGTGRFSVWWMLTSRFIDVHLLVCSCIMKWSKRLPEVTFVKACVCAQSVQPCLTLCDPMDCSPLGSSTMEFSR